MKKHIWSWKSPGIFSKKVCGNPGRCMCVCSVCIIVSAYYVRVPVNDGCVTCQSEGCVTTCQCRAVVWARRCASESAVCTACVSRLVCTVCRPCVCQCKSLCVSVGACQCVCVCVCVQCLPCRTCQCMPLCHKCGHGVRPSVCQVTASSVCPYVLHSTVCGHGSVPVCVCVCMSITDTTL